MKTVENIADELSKSVDLSNYFESKTNSYTRKLSSHEKAIMQAISDLEMIEHLQENKDTDYSDAQE